MLKEKAEKFKKKLKIVGVSFMGFLLFLMILFGGIGGGADAPSSIASYYTQGIGLEEYNTIYKKVIDEVQTEKKYELHFYQLAWYYSLTQEPPNYKQVKEQGLWIAEHKASTNNIVKYYQENSPYQNKLEKYQTQVLIDFVNDFVKIDEAITQERENNPTTSQNGGTTGKTKAPANFGSGWYTVPKNPSSNSGYMGQCTWYAWGRSNEVFSGKYQNKPARNARTWIEDWQQQSGMIPAVNAIAVWGGEMQHVAFVESYDGKTITLSEGNYNPKQVCVAYACSIYDAIEYTNTWTGTLVQLKARQGNNGPFLGFIYLN